MLAGFCWVLILTMFAYETLEIIFQSVLQFTLTAFLTAVFTNSLLYIYLHSLAYFFPYTFFLYFVHSLLKAVDTFSYLKSTNYIHGGTYGHSFHDLICENMWISGKNCKMLGVLCLKYVLSFAYH